MKRKLDVNNDLKKVDIQYLPCKTDYDGEVNIEKFFNPFCEEIEDSNEIDIQASLRGYPLTGKKLPVPTGYTGIIVKEVKSKDNDKKDLRAYSSFNDITFWNWDKRPSRADKYQQAMDWIDISKAIHEDEEGK